MDLFKFTSYKDYVLKRLKAFPKGGRGQLRRMAEHLGAHPVVLTQVFKGDRELSLENATDLADFLGFSELERNYFLLLVQRARAGTPRLREVLDGQLKILREKATDLKELVPNQVEFSEADKAIFYSNWLYTALSLAPSLPQFKTPEALAQYFNLPLHKVNQIIEFLLRFGLLVRKNNELDMGVQSTHIDAGSPLVSRHHTNWRLVGLSKVENLSAQELFITAPMTLSKETMVEIRADIISLIDRTVKKVHASPSEQLMCLNVDLFLV